MNTANYTYTGNSIKPAVTSDLVLNKDYTVAYKNNINVGTATVSISGKGNYSGTVTKSFKIVAKSLNSTEFSLSGTSYIFTSKAITPSVKSSLKLNTDYTVNYKNNVNVGTATPTDINKVEALIQSEQAVKQRIAKFKQKNDDKKDNKKWLNK